MAEINREKVIRGLEISIISDTDAGFSTIEIPVQQAENILALLKEQEAKCMTKEELSGLHEQQFVWLEGKHGSLYCLRIIGICAGNDGVTDIQYDTPNSYLELSTEKYGVKFRLWTAEPTDEQRQVVKWND